MLVFIVTHWWIWTLALLAFMQTACATEDSWFNRIVCTIPAMLVNWAPGMLSTLLFMLFFCGSALLMFISIIGAMAGVGR